MIVTNTTVVELDCDEVEDIVRKWAENNGYEAKSIHIEFTGLDEYSSIGAKLTVNDFIAPPCPKKRRG